MKTMNLKKAASVNRCVAKWFIRIKANCRAKTSTVGTRQAKAGNSPAAMIMLPKASALPITNGNGLFTTDYTD